jgi:hypothetical protein
VAELAPSIARQLTGEVQISAPKVLDRPKVVREAQPPNEEIQTSYSTAIRTLEVVAQILFLV